MVPWNIPWNIGKRGVEHSVPRNFVAQSVFVKRLIIIAEHKMAFRGTFVKHCSTKRYVEYNDAKGAKTAFFAHFVDPCAKCSTGNNPRKRLIFCFVWKLGMSGLLNKKVPYF